MSLKSYHVPAQVGSCDLYTPAVHGVRYSRARQSLRNAHQSTGRASRKTGKLRETAEHRCPPSQVRLKPELTGRGKLTSTSPTRAERAQANHLRDGTKGSSHWKTADGIRSTSPTLEVRSRVSTFHHPHHHVPPPSAPLSTTTVTRSRPPRWRDWTPARVTDRDPPIPFQSNRCGMPTGQNHS